jgi:hypothetical protein
MYRLILILGVVALSGCTEPADSVFRDLQAAGSAGAIERGWIPEWAPRSSVELYQAHDADSNESMLAARYDPGERIEWGRSCEPVDPYEPPQPPFRRKWWPSDVPASRWSTPRHTFLRCGEHSFAAFGQGGFYYWRRAGT